MAKPQDLDALIAQYGGTPAQQSNVDALIQQYGGKTAAPAPPEPTAMDTAAQWAGVVNRAVGPYLGAAGLGFAAGGPPGAALATGALGATDVASGLYNLGANLVGGRRIPSGSEMIQRGGEELGVFRRPETPAQRIVSAGLEGATGAGMQARALRTLEGALPVGSATRGVVGTLAERPNVQAAAGAGAAATPQAVAEAGQTNPFALAFSSVLGGAVGGASASKLGRLIDVKRTPLPSSEDFKALAQKNYDEVAQAGVLIKPQAYDTLLGDLQSELRVAGYVDNPPIRSALTRLERAKGTNRWLQEVDAARSDIAKTLVKNPDANVRRLGANLTNIIDDFVTQLKPTDVDLGAGNLDVARGALSNARVTWRTMAKTKRIEEALENASFSSQPFDTAIRSEFRKLRNSRNYKAQFDLAEREAIDNVVRGAPFTRFLTGVGKALSLDNKLMGPALALGPAINTFRPGADALSGFLTAGGVATTGLTAGAIANALARSRAREAALRTRGYQPLMIPYRQMALPIGQNALASPDILNALAE